jgi:hypothetical protein
MRPEVQNWGLCGWCARSAVCAAVQADPTQSSMDHHHTSLARGETMALPGAFWCCSCLQVQLTGLTAMHTTHMHVTVKAILLVLVASVETGGDDHDGGARWGQCGLCCGAVCGCLQVRLMCQFGNSVTVEVLPVYKPSQAEKDDPALYAANIRKLIVSDTGLSKEAAQVLRSRCPPQHRNCSGHHGIAAALY